LKDDTRAAIQTLMQRIDVPDHWGLQVFRWGPSSVAESPRCEKVRSSAASRNLVEEAG
jgi:hypothetical protein